MMILLLILVLDSATVSHIAVAPHESLTVRALQVSRPLADGDRVPIVLLPGLLGGTFGYRKVTPDIEAEGHSTYVIEPLGVGSSSHPDGGDYSLDAQADRIAAVLDTFDVTSAIIVGSNFGASVALRVAYRHPERVAAVLLLDGGPVDRSSTGGASIALRLAPLLRFFGGRGMARHRIADALREYSADPSWVTDDVVEAYSRPIVNNIGGAARVLSAMRRAPVNTPLAELLSQIRQPVRLLIGAANRRGGIESGETELLRARLPDFAADSVANSGVYVHEEHPEVVVRAILSLTENIRHPVAVSAVVADPR
ncbi:MAG TPA: alpha/beta hydrolase [Gemmatimonadaceae bacterium]|nr:alpha/beta hydrolase [Gemmatimonadaceae bacterium]